MAKSGIFTCRTSTRPLYVALLFSWSEQDPTSRKMALVSALRIWDRVSAFAGNRYGQRGGGMISINGSPDLPQQNPEMPSRQDRGNVTESQWHRIGFDATSLRQGRPI